MITKPGIYTNISSADYFSDPCPKPSLTQSIAKIILENSPAHAWQEHPRLNPKWQPSDPTKFDVGNIAHSLLLRRGKEIVVIEGYDDWRKDKPKQIRDELLREGKHGVLQKHYILATRMVDAAKQQLFRIKDLPELFSAFWDNEACLAWLEEGLWFRQLVDGVAGDRLIVADYKSTDMSVAPHSIGRKMASDNWPIQAAMAERGLNMLKAEQPARRYFFVAQETYEPYALTVCELSEGHLERGRQQLDRAIQIWKHCIKHDQWPSYPRQIIVPDFPGWVDADWEDRRLELDDRKRQMVTEIA